MKMSLFQYILILLVPLLAINLYAAIAEADWLMQATQLIFVPGLAGIYIKLKKNMSLNAILFFIFFFVAQINGFIFNTNNLTIISFFFYIIAYFGLSREALQNTQLETASKTILVYFFLLIAINAYLLFTHVLELKQYMSDELEFGIYIAYYGVLLVMLVLTFIFSNVFRDSAYFYMKDSAILITGNLLWYNGLIFSLLFFLTPERKLRLLNLL